MKLRGKSGIFGTVPDLDYLVYLRALSTFHVVDVVDNLSHDFRAVVRYVHRSFLPDLIWISYLFSPRLFLTIL